MKKLVLTIALAVLAASSAQAGQIFGSLKEGGRPLANAYFEVVMCRDNEKAVYKEGLTATAPTASTWAGVNAHLSCTTESRL